MKINEVVVHEIERSSVNSNPNIPIGKRVTLPMGRSSANNPGEFTYEWNGQNWINISRGTQVAPTRIQQELNSKFPKPEFDNPKGPFKGPDDQPDVMTDPRTGETKPKQPTGGGSSGGGAGGGGAGGGSTGGGEQPAPQDPLRDKFRKPGPKVAGSTMAIATRSTGPGDESAYPDKMGKANKFWKPLFPDAGYLSVKNTNAAGVTYKGIEVDRVLVPIHYTSNDDIIKNNHAFYVLDNNVDQFRLIDKSTKQGLAVTRRIVNAIKSIPPSLKDRIIGPMKDAVADFFDPDKAGRAGYDVLQKDNAKRDALGVIGARIGGKIDKFLGLDKGKLK